jgi:16S rRNA G966 N2-methylase RsmD
MLDKLPKEVWKNKNLKWLDPATGMGNFSIAVYLRLIETLKEVIVNEKERKKHILENMLYMSELNKKNVLICKQIFDINNEYKLNIYEGDSLNVNYNKEFNIKEFDIIMGNPPYQDSNATGDNKLYLDFTKKSLDILINNGLLLFITPRNILEYLLLVEKNRKYIDDFYQLKYLAIETSNKHFPKVGSTFAYFLIEKKIYYEKTIIEYMYCNKIETIKIMLEKGFKIPRVLTKLDIEILSQLTSKTNNYILHDFMFDNKTQRIRKQHIDKNIVSIKETDKNKIKIIDTINKTTPFPGKYYYYNLKDNDFNKDKLILSKKGYLMPYVDKTKSYTYSDNFKYIIDDDIEQIKLLFESKIVKYLLFQYSKNGFDSIDIIKTINKKNLKNIKIENELYKLYNLTEEHINHINNILRYK